MCDLISNVNTMSVDTAVNFPGLLRCHPGVTAAMAIGAREAICGSNLSYGVVPMTFKHEMQQLFARDPVVSRDASMTTPAATPAVETPTHPQSAPSTTPEALATRTPLPSRSHSDTDLLKAKNHRRRNSLPSLPSLPCLMTVSATNSCQYASERPTTTPSTLEPVTVPPPQSEHADTADKRRTPPRYRSGKHSTRRMSMQAVSSDTLCCYTETPRPNRQKASPTSSDTEEEDSDLDEDPLCLFEQVDAAMPTVDHQNSALWQLPVPAPAALVAPVPVRLACRRKSLGAEKLADEDLSRAKSKQCSGLWDLSNHKLEHIYPLAQLVPVPQRQEFYLNKLQQSCTMHPAEFQRVIDLRRRVLQLQVVRDSDVAESGF
eukprot:GFYU01006066.1.p1 GENE.GFYU01006066.1~~GFYU01006066.1.p1  ORF type:complete len:375 (-),score=41.36 GFYU01006066.1:159-1283(-)